MGELEIAPVPIVALRTTVRGQTWQGFAPIHVEPADVTWELVAGAADDLLERARDEHADRGLPAPKLAGCSWRGGVILPPQLEHQP